MCIHAAYVTSHDDLVLCTKFRVQQSLIMVIYVSKINLAVMEQVAQEHSSVFTHSWSG